MKSWKMSLVAVMAGALCLVLILGASIGTAALPDPNLADDIVSMGNAGQSNIKIIDVNGQTVVNTLSGGLIQNIHGTLFDGRYLYSGSASYQTGGLTVAKYDLGGDQAAGGFQYATPANTAGAFCGVEFTQNNLASRVVWGERMNTTTGGLYGWDVDTGVYQGFIDTNPGGASNNTCGVAWDAAGTTAYASLMNAKRTNDGTGPLGPFSTNGGTLHADKVHIMDTAKSKGLAFTSHGTGAGGGIYIVDLATMNEVGNIDGDSAVADAYSNVHSTQVAHGDTYLYAHSRIGEANSGQNADNPNETGATLVYDISNTTVANPTASLVGVIPDEGIGGSCGVDVGSKAVYCSTLNLSLGNASPYWASMADYLAGILAVDYDVTNHSATSGAHNFDIVGTVNTMGVASVNHGFPMGIAAGETRTARVEYAVPGGVVTFDTTIYATANDLCGNTSAFPGPYPGP